jgi:hypothetical protein
MIFCENNPRASLMVLGDDECPERGMEDTIWDKHHIEVRVWELSSVHANEEAAWEHCMLTCKQSEGEEYDTDHLLEVHRDHYYPFDEAIARDYRVMYSEVADVYRRKFAGRTKAFAMGLCASESNPLSRMRRHPWFNPQLLSLLCR